MEFALFLTNVLSYWHGHIDNFKTGSVILPGEIENNLKRLQSEPSQGGKGIPVFYFLNMVNSIME